MLQNLHGPVGSSMTEIIPKAAFLSKILIQMGLAHSHDLAPGYNKLRSFTCKY